MGEPTNLSDLSIEDTRALLLKKAISAVELTKFHLQRIENFEPQLEAFNCLTAPLALKEAAAIDKAIGNGEELAPLSGVCLAVKDNICLPGYPTTCSSKILENFCPPYESTATARLRAAGAIIVGKTNLDEFAMGSSTENSAFRKTKNPWNKATVPGGSSGGSACAVASGMSVIALGSDTGGSIRQPASFCGVVGMKPTYGLVSRYGLVAFASSLDQIGPFGRCVKDVATTLQVMSGKDPKDATSYGEALSIQDLEKPIQGKKIGLVKELMGEGIEPEIREALRKAMDCFERLGAQVEEISMPMLEHALPVYYLIATAEASANLARFDGVRYGHRACGEKDILGMYFKTRQEGFGAEVKLRIMLGTYALSQGYYDAYYLKAQQVRRLIKQEFESKFMALDLIAMPTSPTVAFALGEKTEDPLSMYLSDIATIPANLAGLPGISVPCGFGKGGLPIGMQLLGPPLADEQILQAAHAFEKANEFSKMRPPDYSPVAQNAG